MTPNVDVWNDHAFDPVPENDWRTIDAMLGLPDDPGIRRLAQMMNASHRGQKNETERWPIDFREIGLFAERAFCRVFGTHMDTTVRRYGSGRKNVTLSDGTTVDVMGRRLRPDKSLPDLTRKVGGHRQRADVCCLVLWIDTTIEPVFLGWMSDREIIARGELQKFSYGNSINRVVPLALLRPMSELMARHRPDSPLARGNEERTA
jgi:hypothetical protein